MNIYEGGFDEKKNNRTGNYCTMVPLIRMMRGIRCHEIWCNESKNRSVVCKWEWAVEGDETTLGLGKLDLTYVLT